MHASHQYMSFFCCRRHVKTTPVYHNTKHNIIYVYFHHTVFECSSWYSRFLNEKTLRNRLHKVFVIDLFDIRRTMKYDRGCTRSTTSTNAFRVETSSSCAILRAPFVLSVEATSNIIVNITQKGFKYV